MKNKSWGLLVVLAILISCQSKPSVSNQNAQDSTMQDKQTISLTKKPYGQTPDGPADLFTFKNENGMVAEITNYGGIITSIIVPDRDGNLADVNLGFDSLNQYLDGNPFFGALVGRYGNRIGGAKFTIDGTEYPLLANNGANHLHGGKRGFDKHLWEGKIIDQLPYDLNDCAIEPQWRSFPGWDDPVADCTDFSEIDPKAAAYIDALENMLNCKITMVSTGPDREKLMIKP